jgi:hypothetical protein
VSQCLDAVQNLPKAQVLSLAIFTHYHFEVKPVYAMYSQMALGSGLLVLRIFKMLNSFSTIQFFRPQPHTGIAAHVLTSTCKAHHTAYEQKWAA